MFEPEDSVREDLILAVDGEADPNFVYEEDDDGRLIAIEFDEDGDMVARYHVKVHLEEL